MGLEYDFRQQNYLNKVIVNRIIPRSKGSNRSCRSRFYHYRPNQWRSNEHFVILGFQCRKNLILPWRCLLPISYTFLKSQFNSDQLDNKIEPREYEGQYLDDSARPEPPNGFMWSRPSIYLDCRAFGRWWEEFYCDFTKL